MTAKEIQQRILDETGLKTSVKLYKSGSMKGYVRIMPIYQNGCYPRIPSECWQKLREDLKAFDYANFPLFCGYSEVCVYGIEDDRLHMKKENKPKQPDPNKPMKGWGSKNSQMRLEKATARNAKKMNKGGVARYY